MGITLHELTDIGLKIKALMDASETPEDWRESLDAIEGDVRDKLIGCGHVYADLVAEINVYETEAVRLRNKADSLTRRAESLREYAEANAQAMNIEEVKEGTLHGKWRKLPAIVEIADLDKIPGEYLRHIPESYAPDKVLLKGLLAAGRDIPGAHLATERKAWRFV